MKLGSRAAKVLNTRDFPAGSEIKMSRAVYKIQPDGSIRRIQPKPNRVKRGIVFTKAELAATKRLGAVL